MRRKRRFAANIFLLAILLYLSLYSAWKFAYSSDFFYPAAYYAFGIEDRMQKCSSENADFQRFSKLDANDHAVIFRNILSVFESDSCTFNDLTYRYKDKTYPVMSQAESEQFCRLKHFLWYFKSLMKVMIFGLLITFTVMYVFNLQPYRWYLFVKWLAGLYSAFVVFLLFFGIKGLCNVMNYIFFRKEDIILFEEGSGLINLMVPYPSAYISIFLVVSLSTLVFWIIYFKMASVFIKLFIDKNIL